MISALLPCAVALATLRCASETVGAADDRSANSNDETGTPAQGTTSDADASDANGGEARTGFDAGNFAPGPIDDLLAALPSNHWLELPGSAMREVCPAPYVSGTCRAVQSAWSGGSYDTRRDRLVVFGGGHADSFYNQLFVFDLGQMKWHRMTEMPAGATSSTPTSEMNYVPIEPCGYYPKAPLAVPAELLNPAGTYIRHEACDLPEISALLDDQQPRSSHTYSKCVYDALEDRFCYLAGAYYRSAQSMGRRVPCFSFKTGLWSRVADIPKGSRGASAVDAQGHFWSLPNETGRLYEYVPSSNTWVSHVSYAHTTGYLTGDVDRKRHHLLVMSNAGVRRFDLNAPEQPGVVLATTGPAAPSVGHGGFVYADALDRFVAWSGGSEIYLLDPATLVWTRRDAEGTAPGPQLNNGTYGRFRYSPLRGVFVLANGADANVFVYKP